ncbi:Crinkler (CRN) [Phytophthora megakarya]|uniref:Crinkler (CRN) n=1 Tax=Phytophthora megakarya TaxID=4795 RepID=A0A225VFR1_9STRA|nr:Crinkler (CRN) [Phytophthora megakarya]
MTSRDKGIGKTRMLEEGANILRDMVNLDEERIKSVIIPYCGEFEPLSIEAIMQKKSVHTNCLHSFETWFTLRLSVNGDDLMFESAVKAIELKGVDEYQVIERVNAQREHPDTSHLRELVDAIGNF